jgi:hypothetical protein
LCPQTLHFRERPLPRRLFDERRGGYDGAVLRSREKLAVVRTQKRRCNACVRAVVVVVVR